MSKNGVSDELAKKLDALAAHFEAACHVGDAYMVEENAADAKTLRDAAAALRSKPVAGVEVAANELGNPDEWKSKFEELASWTGSAWIAGEPSEDLRGDCYNFLCTLLGFMQSGEAAARHLSALLPKATAPVVSEPVAYMHKLGAVWRVDNCPAGIDFTEDGWTPLYASPQPEAVINEEMVERVAAKLRSSVFPGKTATNLARELLEAALKED